MVIIELSKNKAAIVDDADYEHLSKWRWCADPHNGIYYASRKANGKKVYMHRVILGLTDPKIKTDHKDGDGLNNTRGNLREATHCQNNINRRKVGSVSKYRGIYHHNGRRVAWGARIKVDYKCIRLGNYVNERDAAQAYNWAAAYYFGEFAKSNEGGGL